MFFILLLLFFSNFSPSHSLKCMTKKDSLSLFSCSFELNINEPFPTDSTITRLSHNCEIEEATVFGIGVSLDSSCYAEITINYNTKKLSVKTIGLTLMQSKMSPYDDMAGLLTGINSVVQYKIEGKWEGEELTMTTRFQCKTFDNCALNKLRRFLPNLTNTENRLKVFKHLKGILNPFASGDESPLRYERLAFRIRRKVSKLFSVISSCLTSDPDNDEICAANVKSCQYRHDKNGASAVGCHDPTLPSKYDVEYRFNSVEEIEAGGDDTSSRAMKIFYLCSTSHCNTDGNIGIVRYSST